VRSSRLAALCSRLDRPLLASSAFAREIPSGAVHLGTHAVRGLPAPEDVYTYELATRPTSAA
jgi:hypothetical protein